uniref:alpha-mannosidase n=1 Tax=Daucus carota subsp. sativus TaxID=79200 RepID=A0A164XFA1_DAUCS
MEAFFQRWWRDQSEATQNTVKRLVESGQLELINGGMCMHDEAAPHYIDMIDQTTLGHRFVKQVFNVTPRIGWQIDPFGHSAVQAYLLGAEVGFDSLFFGRIDYQDRTKRKAEKSLEVVWQGSKSLRSSAQAEDVVATALACMVESASKSECESPTTKFQQANDCDISVCPLLNISYCPPTEVDLSSGKKLVIVVYNSLGWKKTDVVKIPVMDKRVAVFDSNGNSVESQLVPIASVSIGIRNFYTKAHVGKSPNATPKYWLAFTASVPPLGFRTYVVSTPKGADAAASLVMRKSYKSFQNDDYTIEVGTGHLKLLYSVNEGKLTHYVNDESKIKASVQQSFMYYNGVTEDSQADGAYVFRPNSSFPLGSKGQTPIQVFRGPLYDEVRQSINPWIHQITRVYKDKEHAEVEFKVGPIPIDDGVGKDVVTKITTSTKSNKIFYTDSNGRDFLQRIRDFREDWKLEVNQPVAGNYYPINLGMYLKDDSSEVSVLVDRSVGGSSIIDGQMELMLHRRLLHDDGRGVAEALNETVCISGKCAGLTIQGKYYLRIDPLGEGAKWRRSYGQEIYSPFLLAFTEQDGDKSTKFQVSSFSYMDSSYSLPDNVALLTLQELEDGTVLLRLAHLYEFRQHYVVGSSIIDGQMELMLHRRLLHDDGRGVAEALNETVCISGKCAGLTIQGKYYLRIDPLGEGAKWRRSYGQEIYSPFLLAFTEQDGDKSTKFQVSSFSYMDSSYSLPDNVALLTLQELEDGTVLLRLAHLYEIGEDKLLSKLASVELKKIFSKRKIHKIDEMSLSANQGREEMERKRLVWKVEGSHDEPKVLRGGPVDPQKLVVELAPMEIRTFVIKFGSQGSTASW